MKILINTDDYPFGSKLDAVWKNLVKTLQQREGEAAAAAFFMFLLEHKRDEIRSLSLRTHPLILELMNPENLWGNPQVKGISLVETDFQPEEVRILFTGSYPHDDGSEMVIYTGDKIRTVQAVKSVEQELEDDE